MNANLTAGPKYPKIPGPWKRETEGPNRNQLIEGEWTSPELALLADVPNWLLTEKLDGTNIRVHWTGYEVVFGGRTDNAQMPPALDEWLKATFQEELFEQKFGDTPVTLYGEGIGPRIQSGGAYGETRVVLFDVRIGDMWLLRSDVEDVAESMGVEVAPLVLTGADLFEGIDLIRSGFKSRLAKGDLVAEGVVATLATGLLDRRGNRIQVKLKARDLT